MSIIDLIRKLPIDIIKHIIPYTYNIQNMELIEDIKNYKIFKTIINNLYYDFWIVKMGENEPEDKNWIANDLMAFTNDYYATMYGYVDTFYETFYRNFILKTKRNVDKYIHKLEKREINTQINVFLGILTPFERLLFVNNVIENITVN